MGFGIGINTQLGNNYNPTAGFDPSEYSPAFWVDATDASTILNASDVAASNGENVKTWQDKSGNGYHVAQTTVNRQPIYRTAGNGIDFAGPCLDFDDVVNSTHLNNSVAPTLMRTGNTEFFVFSNRGGGGANSYMITGGVSTGHLFGGTGTGTATTVDQGMFAGAFANIITYDLDTPYVTTLIHNSTASYHSINNDAAIGPGNPGTLSSNGINIGSSVGGSGPVECEIAEILIFNRVLSTEELSTMKSYLIAKHGIV